MRLNNLLSHSILFDEADDSGAAVPETPEVETPPEPEVTPAEPVTSSGDDGNNPAWLPDRLRRAERAAVNNLLSEIGIDDVETLKAAMADARKLEDEKKTESERLNEQLGKLKPKAERADALESAFTQMLERDLEAVDETLRPRLDAVLDAIPTPEAKYAAMRNWLAAVEAVKQENTTTGKPQAPNLNAREGAASTGDLTETPDEYLAAAQELGWTQEEIEKYTPKR